MYRPFVAHLLCSYVVPIQKYLLTVQIQTIFLSPFKYLLNCSLSIYKQELEERTVDEVDESVQVETLRFEQDSAVQVDTLPPLTKLTSRDAYLYELETAIQECITNLNSLEDALHSPTPPQGSRSQGSSPQMVRICLLLCWYDVAGITMIICEMTRRMMIPKLFPALGRGHPTVLTDVKQNSRLSVITTVICLTVPFNYV